MNQLTKSLLKYDNPVLISKSTGRLSQKEPLKVGPQDPDPLSSGSRKKHNQETLNSILPPREWWEGNQLWVQQVSSAPCTRTDVIHLEEQLDIKLQQRHARQTGICPVRRELYSQYFDELIRQVTMNCAERGMLMLRLKNEIQTTLDTYQTLYESSIAFGMRKALQAMQDKADMEERICDLENEKQDLKNQLNEQKARCDTIEKRANEKAQNEEKRHNEEIQFMKKLNQQLEAQMKEKVTLKKQQDEDRHN